MEECTRLSLTVNVICQTLMPIEPFLNDTPIFSHLFYVQNVPTASEYYHKSWNTYTLLVAQLELKL